MYSTALQLSFEPPQLAGGNAVDEVMTAASAATSRQVEAATRFLDFYSQRFVDGRSPCNPFRTRSAQPPGGHVPGKVSAECLRAQHQPQAACPLQA